MLTAGQQVVRVPPKLMAQARASARTRGKSDPIDALAVARAFLREPDLPIASHDEVSRELKLLVDRREVLVAQRTATINRLRWRIHELDPERAPKPASLDLAKHRGMLAALAGHRFWTGRRAGSRRAGRHHPAHRNHQRVDQAYRRSCPSGGASAVGSSRLRGVDRGQTRRRGRRSQPVQKRGSLCPSCRCGPDTGVVGQHRRAGAVDPLGQSSTQRRPAPYRRDPDPPRRPRPGLLPQKTQHGRLQSRSVAQPQTPPSPSRLPPPSH